LLNDELYATAELSDYELRDSHLLHHYLSDLFLFVEKHIYFNLLLVLVLTLFASFAFLHHKLIGYGLFHSISIFLLLYYQNYAVHLFHIEDLQIYFYYSVKYL
jgi:hypothetical protein